MGRGDSRGAPWRRCRPPRRGRRPHGTAHPRRSGGRAAPGEGSPRPRPAAPAGPTGRAPVLRCDKARLRPRVHTGLQRWAMAGGEGSLSADPQRELALSWDQAQVGRRWGPSRGPGRGSGEEGGEAGERLGGVDGGRCQGGWRSVLGWGRDATGLEQRAWLGPGAQVGGPQGEMGRGGLGGVRDAAT